MPRPSFLLLLLAAPAVAQPPQDMLASAVRPARTVRTVVKAAELPATWYELTDDHGKRWTDPDADRLLAFVARRNVELRQADAWAAGAWSRLLAQPAVTYAPPTVAAPPMLYGAFPQVGSPFSGFSGNFSAGSACGPGGCGPAVGGLFRGGLFGGGFR